MTFEKRHLLWSLRVRNGSVGYAGYEIDGERIYTRMDHRTWSEEQIALGEAVAVMIGLFVEDAGKADIDDKEVDRERPCPHGDFRSACEHCTPRKEGGE